MRAALISLVGLALAACTTLGEAGSNVSGTADYDALRRTQQECAAQGGKLVLKDGGDAQHIQDYTCKRS